MYVQGEEMKSGSCLACFKVAFRTVIVRFIFWCLICWYSWGIVSNWKWNGGLVLEFLYLNCVSSLIETFQKVLNTFSHASIVRILAMVAMALHAASFRACSDNAAGCDEAGLVAHLCCGGEDDGPRWCDRCRFYIYSVDSTCLRSIEHRYVSITITVRYRLCNDM